MRHISELLQQAVLNSPDSEALVFQRQRWTYRDLGARVDAAAEWLRPRLAGYTPRVGIVGRNHPAFVIAYFAVQSLGASTIEVSPDESSDAVSHAMTLAKPSVMFTDRPELQDVLGSIAPVRMFDWLMALSDEQAVAKERPAPSLDASQEASVVFTSGTTGLPKGVCLTHGNVLYVVDAVCQYLEMTRDDRCAVVLPLCHTYGKSTLLTAVACGGAAVLVGGFQDLRAFFGELSRERCTILSLVPFHLNVMARRAVLSQHELGSVRAITTSGGPLSWDTADAVLPLFPGARLFPMYGLTESSTRVTYLPPEYLSTKRGSVGRPLPGVRIEIRGEDRVTPLPEGMPGEIAVRGPNVMSGYLGDTELTAETLVDGWLMTGDIGFLDADGFLFIVGRQKEIIKIAGERVSPTEIEAVLASHPGVSDAAVGAHPDPLLGEVAHAYYVPGPGVYDTLDLARHCAARLSPHKIPRRFAVVDYIPRTPTGKVRRHLLLSRSEPCRWSSD